MLTRSGNIPRVNHLPCHLHGCTQDQDYNGALESTQQPRPRRQHISPCSDYLGVRESDADSDARRNDTHVQLTKLIRQTLLNCASKLAVTIAICVFVTYEQALAWIHQAQHGNHLWFAQTCYV
ncbi:hypothetical protein V3C99_012510 [Haemonchus contortus]|uniref:Uncharacterized protein n=1 Tax=Haemonchus contortus TaxID=6289 RepID=A0A7I4Y3W9_HAECO